MLSIILKFYVVMFEIRFRSEDTSVWFVRAVQLKEISAQILF